jgi:cytidine deaminase
MTLAYDVCRCDGWRDESNRLVTPCVTCRRVVNQYPAGERTPWFVTAPPLKDDTCEYAIPVH